MVYNMTNQELLDQISDDEFDESLYELSSYYAAAALNITVAGTITITGN